MIIYHNPRCSKSRQTLALLEENGAAVEVIEYLKTPPSVEELRKLKAYLGAKSAQEFIRKKEDVYKEQQLHEASEEDVLKAIAKNPVLLERPIVVANERAVIGRPPENVLKLL